MLRFSYSDITDMLRMEREKNEKRIFMPKVSGFPNLDFDQLVYQVSMMKAIAQTVIDMHCRDSFVDPKSCPSIEESLMFIKVMDSFYNYLNENKVLIKSNTTNLENVLKTVLVVKRNKVISSSKDVHLNMCLKELTYGTRFLFTKDEPVF